MTNCTYLWSFIFICFFHKKSFLQSMNKITFTKLKRVRFRVKIPFLRSPFFRVKYETGICTYFLYKTVLRKKCWFTLRCRTFWVVRPAILRRCLSGFRRRPSLVRVRQRARRHRSDYPDPAQNRSLSSEKKIWIKFSTTLYRRFSCRLPYKP